ncbi:HAMP domain-containing protein [Nakamurella sp. UYEF19]|uniref:hypothetical protein n=1 Tax=Nakamurella sp. UYEF19 TaxID=1756392 RepID=UPI003394FC9D
MNTNGVATGTWTVVLAILAALLVLMIARSVRKAFSRPAPSTQAVQAFSLATGRSMLLAGIVVAWLLSRPVQDRTGASATIVGIMGIVALALQMLSETRWPRQSGAVRVAMLGRPTLRETVLARYRYGSAAAGVCITVAVIFALFVGPAANRSTNPATACPAPVGVICTSYGAGDSVTQTFSDAAPTAGAILVALASLLVMLVIAAFAVRQVLRRPVLAGIDPSTDQALRRVAAQRVFRLVTAGFLAMTASLTSGVRDALNANDLANFNVAPGGLAQALMDFLTVVSIGCGLAILVLYIVGPNERTLRRALLPGRVPTDA